MNCLIGNTDTLARHPLLTKISPESQPRLPGAYTRTRDVLMTNVTGVILASGTCFDFHEEQGGRQLTKGYNRSLVVKHNLPTESES